MEKNKRTVMQAVICVVLVCMIWGGYFFLKHFGADRILEVRDADFSLLYQVDGIEKIDDKIVISGFVFELQKDATEGMFEIVLQDVESEKNYFLKTEHIERDDVNEYFLCEYDYLQSGFEASIKEKKLELNERDYEVLLRVTNERLTYKTGIYISNGELMYAKPAEFKALDVKGTDLEDIVKNGVLRVYRPDYGVYVYQCNGELYWIAEEGKAFANGNTFIEYQLGTTQIDRLPEERLKNQWHWDNIGFEFSEKKLVGKNTGKYSVAKEVIPKEYSIEKIWTGNYVEGWIWQQYFRPYYQFD